MEVSVGAGGFTIVNGTVLLVPLGVATETFRVLRFAPGAIVRVEVILVEFTTTGVVAVMPAPETFTSVAPVRLLPWNVTFTEVPRAPVLGLIDVSTGSVPVTSTAPTSTLR